MEMSESIGKLAEALAKAQGQIENAKKKSANPFFKSRYADLAECLISVKMPLKENGLSFVQCPGFDGKAVSVTTTLLHTSGEWISSELKLAPTKTDPQSVGSAITYARRYSLCAMVGLSQEDDDGNRISKKE